MSWQFPSVACYHSSSSSPQCGNHASVSPLTNLSPSLFPALYPASPHLFCVSTTLSLFCLSIFNVLTWSHFLNNSVLSFISCFFLSSCPFCYLIFIPCLSSFYPSFCAVYIYIHKFMTASIVKHLSSMCIISLKAVSQCCTDKQQMCQSKATREWASGFTVSTLTQSHPLQRYVCNNLLLICLHFTLLHNRAKACPGVCQIYTSDVWTLQSHSLLLFCILFFDPGACEVMERVWKGGEVR